MQSGGGGGTPFFVESGDLNLSYASDTRSNGSGAGSAAASGGLLAPILLVHEHEVELRLGPRGSVALLCGAQRLCACARAQWEDADAQPIAGVAGMVLRNPVFGDAADEGAPRNAVILTDAR